MIHTALYLICLVSVIARAAQALLATVAVGLGPPGRDDSAGRTAGCASPRRGAAGGGGPADRDGDAGVAPDRQAVGALGQAGRRQRWEAAQQRRERDLSLEA